MRVLFCTWPAAAHLYPSVPMARALHDAGHEVRVISHPSLLDTIDATGLTGVSLGDERTLPQPLGAGRPIAPDTYADLVRLTESLGLDGYDRYVWTYYRDYMLPAVRDFQPEGAPAGAPQLALDALVGFCRSWRPDLVLWDPTMPAAGVAARVSGAAHARILWGPDLCGWAHEQYTRCAKLSDDALLPEEPMVSSVRPMAERYGLPLTDDLLFGQWTVDPVLERMRLPTAVRTVSMRWEAYAGPAVLPEWLKEPPARPRVAITLGSSIRAWGRDSALLVNRVLEMVDGLDIEAVATLDASQLAVADRIPDNVRTVDYIPLTELLPTCSAVIHHGGHGSFGAALVNRIPQFVVMDPGYPMEAPLTGRFLSRSGVGTGVRVDRHTGVELRAGLSRLLTSPSFRDAAAELYTDLLTAPEPSEIIPVLERLTRHHQSRD